MRPFRPIALTPLPLAAPLLLVIGCGHPSFLGSSLGSAVGRWSPGSFTGVTIHGATSTASQSLAAQRAFEPAPPLPLDPDFVAPTTPPPPHLALSAPLATHGANLGGNMMSLDAADAIELVMVILEASLRPRPVDDKLCDDTVGECIPEPPRLLPSRLSVVPPHAPPRKPAQDPE